MTSPPCNVIFADSGRVLPGGYVFDDGPIDLTTTTLATPAVDPKAIATAVPHSISLRIIQAPRSNPPISHRRLPAGSGRVTPVSLWLQIMLGLEQGQLN